MTVSTTTNKVSYIGNGIATTFAIPFPFLEKEHLKVWQLLNDIQTERTDWTVSGGNMVFETAPVENAQILIIREVPLTQETDYRENEVLPAETLERNFDKLTMQVQQLKEQADRAVTVDIFDDTDAASLIPSIRHAVSECAGYVEDVKNEKTAAQNAASDAAVQAQNALNKANEAAQSAAVYDTVLAEINQLKDGTNFSANGRKVISKLSKPSSVKISGLFSSPITTVLQTYTAPANGMVQINLSIQNGYMTVDNSTTGEGFLAGNTNGICYSTVKVQAKKGEIIGASTYQSTATVFHSEFIYDEGEV